MTAAQVGENAALMEQEALAQLTQVGDEIMAERLKRPDPPRGAQPQQGWRRS